MARSTTLFADASPEKRLFISLLTRDITLIDAILDLIDNSINSAIITNTLKLDDPSDYIALLEGQPTDGLPTVAIEVSGKEFTIKDTTGGIPFNIAQKEVFKFGKEHEDIERDRDRLSVYGIGMKRAIFKIGRRIKMVSTHPEGGFSMDLSVTKWAKDHAQPWQIPISHNTKSGPHFGTEIVISDFFEDVAIRFEDSNFLGELSRKISQTYSFFMGRVVNITVNKKLIERLDIEIGQNHSIETFNKDGVSCTIIAGLANPKVNRYRTEIAGWYVFCNGRAVVFADKSEVTGWGTALLPIFQPKHRPFVGIVFFSAPDPEDLPWNTTKSAINQESVVWQAAKRQMAQAAKSIISFLDSRYSDEGTEVTPENLRAASGGNTPLYATVRPAPSRTFVVAPRARNTETSIQYKVNKTELEIVKKHIGRRSMSNGQVGRYTFDYYVNNEIDD